MTVAVLAAALLLFAVLVVTAARSTLFERTPALVRVGAPSGRRQTDR